MSPFNLKIITPEKIFFDGSAEQLIAKTTSGNVGILAGHSPYVANLVSSCLKIKIDGTFREAAVSGGLLKVSEDGATVMTPAVEWADEIDVARAQRAKEAAQAEITKHASQKEFERAEQRLKRAVNRLTVASKK